MKNLRLKTIFVLGFFAILLHSAPARAKDKWINLSTKNFNIISNADEGESRKLALKLEQFHYVFAKLFNLPLTRRIPTTVMVFRNDGSFRPYKPLYNGKPANLAGYFQPSQDENIIALDISANEQRPLSVIFHEYTHLVTSGTSREWPLWLKEGLAEVYSSFEVDDNKVTLGNPISRHVFLLRDHKFIPLEALFAARHDSPIYNEREKQGIFYAQSWALCHYVMFGDKNVRRPQMVEFVNLIEQGVEADKAFTQAFKTDTREIDKQLHRYVGNSQYTINVHTLESTEGAKEINIRPISEGEAQFYLGNLLARTNRFEEAEGLFKQAVAAEPDLPRPYEGLGFVAMRRNNLELALENFRQAATRGSKNYLAHYYYAQSIQRTAVSGINETLAKAISEELQTSIKLMPGFAYSHASLGFLSLATGRNFKEGAESLKTALRLEPKNTNFRLNLALLQTRLGDYADAKSSLVPLLGADVEPAIKTTAESTMKMIERVTQPGFAGTESTLSDRTERPAYVETSVPAAASPPRLVRRPSLNIEEAQVIRGVLVSVECNGGEWTLVINTRDLLRFAVTNKDKLELYSQDPQFDGKISCGSVNRIAYIYYKPISRRPELAGDVVAIEFTRD
jgi:tetratricopeptide (TPR) repeat protein